MPRSFDGVFYGAAGTSGEVLPSDDEFNNVGFLSHFDGANNGVNNAFDDGSASNHTITANGNVTQGSFNPYGTNWSVDFDGGDYFTVPQDADFNVDDGSYTMECFVNTTFSGYQNIIASWDGATGGNPGWGMFISSGNKFGMFIGTAEVGKAGAVVNDGAWHHLAGVFTNSGATVTLYVDGAQISTGSVTAPADNAASIIRIGAAGNANATSLYTGKISNLRLVKGTAVYSGSSFTVPTSALTAITNTKLLVLGRNNFSDGSASGHVLTPISDPTVTAFGPILTSAVYDPAVNGASLYNGVDANLNYVSAADSADWNLGSGNYTVECWAYATAQGSFNKLVGQWPYEGNNAANSWILETVGTDVEAYAMIGGSAVLIAQGAAFTINAWHYVALVRNGNNHNIYIDGVAGSTTSNSGTYYNGTGALEVGSFSSLGGGSWDGYITDVRVVKGTAVYTSNFTPPTAPLTAITNTKLLLNMADGQAIDSAAQNILTLYNTAKTSTAQKKFGTASLLLDGNSDYATFLENGGNDIDGEGNWTVEFFWRFNDKTSPQYQMLITKSNLQIYTDNGELRLAIGDGSGYFINATGGTTLNNDTWYHIAVVKNGTAYNEYLNGTNEANLDGTSSRTLASGGVPWYIGTLRTAEGTYPANGYIDEVRISRFARYTSNFTAPSAAFADKGQ